MEQKDYRLAAIMYTDIAGFSRMMEKDETGTLKLLHIHNALITEIVQRHHGTVIKTIGDAFLIDFRNTVEALQSALEVQDKLYVHNKENPDLPLLVRIGIHLGDIYFFENDALGEGINIAARLQSLAHPGCICFSQDVYNQVLNKLDFAAAKLGKVSLKNITKEVHAYEITTPNVDFDPNRDKPRPGYKPGTYLDGDEAGSGIPVPPAIPSAPAMAGSPEADRSYTPEGSADVIAEIRRAILADIKAAGRRMSVQEALAKYGEYGVEAQEVIATMADQGLIIKKRPVEDYGFNSQDSDSSELARGIGREVSSAVEGIVGAIERGVHEWDRHDGGRHGYRSERMRQRFERAAARFELKRQDRELETGKWDRDLSGSDYFKPGKEALSRDFEEYKTAVATNERRVKAGLVGNIASFLGVNALLWFLNLTTATAFPWAAIVTAAWGIGVVSNIAAAFRHAAKRRELERLPALDGNQLDLYKKLNRVKDSIVHHTASTLTVPFLLFLINLVTSPEFLWAAIPSGIMVIGWISHLITYRFTKGSLERRFFDSLGHSGGSRGFFRNRDTVRAETESMGRYAALYAEARAARDAIVSQVKGLKKKDPAYDPDLAPQLEEYVGQVKLLTQSANEIDRIIDAIPLGDLEKDKAELSRRLSESDNPSLRREYEKSVGEIEKQQKACKDLEDQREVVRLRLKSSVNALKQMQIDMARLKTLPDSGDQTAIDAVKRRTDELQGYLDDMRRGWDEVSVDPYAELEKLVEERERRERLAPPKEEGSSTPG
ncbi:MAG: 2TM domain-containing protein [Spirochaetes bacterium]|nr:2TM domain-containing protein [Spirochaetota bacterium]